MLTPEIVQGYRESRDPSTNKAVLCHAPFLSLNFEQNGHVTSCCYNRSYVLGVYPEQSLREIWKGAKTRAMREAFLQDSEAPGCDLCFHQLEKRNFGGTLMRNFDRYARDPDYQPELDAPAPRLLEFEIANTCNLECVMCGGHWSSAIRANREKLPPLQSPYDRKFVEQLEEFLPGIAGAKFLGGEPFLIKRYYEIWEAIRRCNPEAELTVTTNATRLSPRARELIEDLRMNIVISIDALVPETFERIRKNARFDEVIRNLEYLLDYTRRRGTWMTLAICPMTYNWRELPDILEYCEKQEIQLHFNTVFRPPEASLGALSPSELGEVVEHLAASQPTGDAWWTQTNRREWEGLVSQLRAWHEGKRQFAERRQELEQGFGRFRASHAPARAGEEVERLAGALTLSYLIAGEKQREGHGDFVNLLPPTPLSMVEGGEEPGAEGLLLAVHLLTRFLGPPHAAGAPAAADLAREQQQLLDYVANRRAADPAWVAEFEGWLRERIAKGEAPDLLAWMDALLSGLGRPDAWQRAFETGLAELSGSGLDPEACRKVAAFFAGAAPRIGSFDVPWLDLGSNVPLPALADADDLAHLLAALGLVHRWQQPEADPALFRLRSERCLEALRRAGQEVEACRLLESGSLPRAYDFLCQASEAELERPLEGLR